MKKVKFVNILFSFGNEANSKSHDKQKTGRRINVQVIAMSRENISISEELWQLVARDQSELSFMLTEIVAKFYIFYHYQMQRNEASAHSQNCNRGEQTNAL